MILAAFCWAWQSVESTRLLPRTEMLGERRNGSRKALVESGNVGRTNLLERSELDVAGDDWGEAPIVGASEGADP